MNYDIIKNYTMTSEERINGLIEKIRDVNVSNVEGSLVECGVWKCGMLGLMSLVNKEYSNDRKIFGFDSFEGLPESNPQLDGKDSINWTGKLAVSFDEAKENLRKMDAKNVILCKGFFENTLHLWKEKIKKIAILRLDGDWYSSTKTCLNELYDLVEPGGYVIIDDYGHWEGCKTAVDEFISFNKINVVLNQSDYTEFWWKK